MSLSVSLEEAYTYAEILEILSFTHISLVKKIPPKLISLFQAHALSTYKHHLDKNIPVDEQDISKHTAALLTLISLNYWCETEDEKNNLKTILSKNEKNVAEELMQKYDPNNIFNSIQTTTTIQKNESIDIQNENTIDNLPVDLTNLPWYKKFFTFLKSFLKK